MSALDTTARGLATRTDVRTAGYEANGDGVAAPASNLVAAAGATGALTGTYYYSVTFVTAYGETAPWPGTATAVIVSGRQIALSAIPVGPAAVIARRIYRTKATSPDPKDYYLVGTITDNSTTTFTDNIGDAALGAPVNWASSNRGYLAAARDAFVRVSTTSSSFGLLNSGAKGYANVSVGNNAMEFCTSGRRNTAVGVYALQNVTIGQRNTALGVHAGNGVTNGEQNTFLGYAAGGTTTAWGNFNVFIGDEAGGTAGASGRGSHIGIGKRALASVSATAEQCIGIGFFAGQYANASRQLFVDNVTRANIGAAQDQGLIYGQAQAAGNPQGQELRLNARVRIGWNPTLALVANLPTASAALRGFRAYVIDATASLSPSSVGAGVTGGGSSTVPVFCTGSAWVIG